MGQYFMGSIGIGNVDVMLINVNASFYFLYTYIVVDSKYFFAANNLFVYLCLSLVYVYRKMH